MSEPKEHVRLELETDEKFSRRNAVAERLVWAILTLFVLAGFAGFFGKGGISRKSRESDDRAVRITYERYLRYNTDAEIKLSLVEHHPGDSLKIIISDEFIDKVLVEYISPVPLESGLTSKGKLYIFRREPGNFIPTVTFHFKPQYSGTLGATFIVAGAQPLSISQFVYP